MRTMHFFCLRITMWGLLLPLTEILCLSLKIRSTKAKNGFLYPCDSIGKRWKKAR